MILDILGVGLIGSTTTFSKDMQHFAEVTDRISNHEPAIIWGTNNRRTGPAMAAYINGSNCHSMDFDDTWHPATHPSSPILPALLALADFLPERYKPSLQDILVAFNCGVQIQGILLRCSSQSKNIPNRYAYQFSLLQIIFSNVNNCLQYPRCITLSSPVAVHLCTCKYSYM